MSSSYVFFCSVFTFVKLETSARSLPNGFSNLSPSQLPTRGAHPAQDPSPALPRAQARPKAQAWPAPGQILEIWEPGNPEIWDPKNEKKWKFSKSKSVLPKILARSGLVGKNTSRSYFGPSEAICSMDRTNTQKMQKLLPTGGIFLGGPIGNCQAKHRRS